MGRTARRSYDLSQVEIVPSRRTRSSKEVSTAWQLDAYRFDDPAGDPPDRRRGVARRAPCGSASSAGSAVLNAEGLWARHADAEGALARVVEAAASDDPDAAVRAAAGAARRPDRDDLLTEALRTVREAGRDRRGAGEPAARPRAGARLLLAAGVEVLVVQGTIISAEHVSTRRAAQPQGLHRLAGDPGGRGRGRRLPHRHAPHAHRRGGRDRRVRRVVGDHHGRGARHRGADGHRDRRRRRRPARLPRRDRRPLRARHRGRRDGRTPATWPRRSPAARTP